MSKIINYDSNKYYTITDGTFKDSLAYYLNDKGGGKIELMVYPQIKKRSELDSNSYKVIIIIDKDYVKDYIE
jgi:hypothetical protein